MFFNYILKLLRICEKISWSSLRRFKVNNFDYFAKHQQPCTPYHNKSKRQYWKHWKLAMHWAEFEKTWKADFCEILGRMKVFGTTLKTWFYPNISTVQFHFLYRFRKRNFPLWMPYHCNPMEHKESICLYCWWSK